MLLCLKLAHFEFTKSCPIQTYESEGTMKATLNVQFSCYTLNLCRLILAGKAFLATIDYCFQPDFSIINCQIRLPSEFGGGHFATPLRANHQLWCIPEPNRMLKKPSLTTKKMDMRQLTDLHTNPSLAMAYIAETLHSIR